MQLNIPLLVKKYPAWCVSFNYIIRNIVAEQGNVLELEVKLFYLGEYKFSMYFQPILPNNPFIETSVHRVIEQFASYQIAKGFLQNE